MVPLKTRGKPQNIHEVIVARVEREVTRLDKNSFFLHEAISGLPGHSLPLGILSTTRAEEMVYDDLPGIYNVLDLSHLDNGDVVSINPDGVIRTLFRVRSQNNSLFVTERCNSNCLMCSQPPRNQDDILDLFQLNRSLIKLIPKDTTELGITGGEPTLMGDLFPELLDILKRELPSTDIHVLTNGRSFNWNETVEKIASIHHPKIVFGVPLYADYYKLHDYIVQAKHAFNQTMLGLYNLARYDLRIEIRVVLHKLSVPRLVNLAQFIGKNLPFVEHVALMGLEYTGYTPFNIEKLWIDPVDYKNELSEAVDILNSHGLLVSIYNHQLCVLPEELWPYSKQAISAWKNDFLEECNLCKKKQDCGGFFTSSLKKHSDFIRPIY